MIRKFFQPKLITAIIVTVLLFFVIGHFSYRALINFYSYKKAVSPAMELTLDRFHFFLSSVLKQEWIKYTAPKVSNDSPLRTFYITVDPKDISKLNADLPQSGKKQYVDGYMRISDDKRTRKIKLRYRGDNNPHWLYKQKSLRIKLSKNDTYNLENKINLINPPYHFSIIDCVNYDLSRELGLISPDFFPVRLFVNNEYMGVYIYLSQIDESLLRKHKRMPGSIYSGDYASVDSHGRSTLWSNQKFWEKSAARNAEQKNDRGDIAFFINAINDFNSLAFYDFVNTFIDKEKYFSFMALDVLLGTNHHDYHHNHKIYFDPYIGKFEPIEWDVRFWIADTHYKDLSIYALLDRIKLNPVLEFERDNAAYKLLQNITPENLMTRLRHYQELTNSDLKSDIFRDTAIIAPNISSTWISTPFFIDEFEKHIDHYETYTLQSRRVFLEELYNNSSVRYFSRILSDGYQELVFEINGNSPVQVNLLEFVKTTNPRSLITFFKNKHIIQKSQDINEILTLNETSPVQILYPGRKIVEGTINNWLKILYGNTHIVNAPLYYSFIIDDDITIKKENVKTTNIITGKIITAQYKSFDIKDTADSIHPWKLPIQQSQHKIFSGTVEIKDTQVFDRHISVTIKPGTTFIMHPGKSIFFYGNVEAVGTEKEPIRFLAKDPNRPWGLVAVQGQKTSRSKFHYVEFSNGSVDSRNLIHYTAQFNIHDTGNFEVKQCKIGKNHVGDDSMHIAYSTGVVENCVFENALSDALDVDIADVVVRNSIFINSGNDSIDLMTSEAIVQQNIFINAGDKGISTGEWTNGRYSSNLFYNCNISLEIKDKSIVNLENDFIINSKEKAINLYNKNMRYDEGGTVTGGSIFVIGNDTIKADKKSRINIRGIIRNKPDIKAFKYADAYLGLDGNWSNLDTRISERVKVYETQ